MFQKIGFLLIEDFALMSCASAVEPLRAANLLADKNLFDVQFYSITGGFVRSSCGGGFDTQMLPLTDTSLDALFIVAGGDPFEIRVPPVQNALQHASARGVTLGGISGGSVVLAKAGLMENRRFTVHWEHFEALQSLSEDYLMERRLYIIDRDRLTCAGGSAPLDMMHAVIRSEHGTELARAVSNWFIQTGVRRAEDPQRSYVRETLSIGDRELHSSVRAAIELMENHLATPLNIPQIARLAGISDRHLHRRFLDEVGKTPKKAYLDMRLRKSDDLLQQTRLPLTEIALTCGFANAAHFAATYKKSFGVSPSSARHQST